VFPAIAMLGEKYKLSTRQVTKTACPPLDVEKVDVGRRRKGFGSSACAKFNAAMLLAAELIAVVPLRFMPLPAKTDRAKG
jgi:hypothetical protein